MSRVRGGTLAAMSVIVLGLALVTAGTGCKRRVDERVDPALIRVTVGANMRTDTVGDQGKQATFVLVDAENRSAKDAFIALGGVLVDSAGIDVGPLRSEELLVPAGTIRTFALIDNDDQARPTASGATIKVESAVVSPQPASMVITDFIVHPDGDRVVAAANLQNTADRAGQVTVFASFHDANGRPLTRPFDVVSIGAGIVRPLRFVGPPGSTRASIYIGELRY